MNEAIAHNSAEFFINKKMMLVRPLRKNESFAQKTYHELLTSENYYTFGELERAPTGTLEEYCNPISGDSFVYIAESAENDQTEPVGVALYIKNKNTGAHEMSLLVSNSFIDTRLPFELASSLIDDAANHRVIALYTLDSTEDINMRKLAKRMNMSVRLEPGDGRTVRYSLMVDKHPGVVFV